MRATGWQSRGRGTRTSSGSGKCGRVAGRGRYRRRCDLAPGIDDLRIDVSAAVIEPAERQQAHTAQKLCAIGVGAGRETIERAGKLARLVRPEPVGGSRTARAQRSPCVIEPLSLGRIEAQPPRIEEV